MNYIKFIFNKLFIDPICERAIGIITQRFPELFKQFSDNNTYTFEQLKSAYGKGCYKREQDISYREAKGILLIKIFELETAGRCLNGDLEERDNRLSKLGIENTKEKWTEIINIGNLLYDDIEAREFIKKRYPDLYQSQYEDAFKEDI